MILIFDLDDTLYDERQYVLSGFAAVAEMGQDTFGWDKSTSLKRMIEILDAQGRGAVFDQWLAEHDALSGHLVKKCVHVYRHHRPTIEMERDTLALLERLAESYSLYLVTDGHKVVQHRKIEALGIGPMFKKTFITHRYGVRNAKPSIHCFDLIRRAERCEWGEMAYIGDNPAKDFVNLNPLGVVTVRVLTGVHRSVEVCKGGEARHTLSTVKDLPDLLERSRD
jgi:putative hydrolase of the HAD superfamily